MTALAAPGARQRIRHANLFVAFAFTIMADPVSSVAYAVEAALGALDGELSSLVPTMACVIGVIALVAAGYHGLIARFPNGGGGAEGLAAAFGEGWAFLPLGALLVDFTLTIAVSCAAAGSALIAYIPELAPVRVPLAAGLVLLVAAATVPGHRARVVFATATLAFVATAGLVLVLGGGVQGQVLTGLLARRGCRVHLADPHAGRRERALRFGAERAHDAPRDEAGAATLREALPGGAGADLVVEAVGRPLTWRLAAALARPGGEVLLHGGCPAGSEVTLPTGPLHYEELTLRGSYHHTPETVRAALDLIAAEALPFAELRGAPVGLAEVPALLAAGRGDKHPVRP